MYNRINPLGDEFNEAMEKKLNDRIKYQEEKNEKENIRFWIPVWISIAALIIAGLSLWLQVRG